MSAAPLELEAPTSKSLTQRALLVAALARGESFLEHPLDCSDSRHLRQGLAALGVTIIEEEQGWRVAGPPSLSGQIVDCGNGGTTLRFLSSLPLILPGALTLDGSARMRERPIGPLAAALESLGVEVRYGLERGFPPLTLQRRTTPGGRVEVDTSVSSQFASSLMMVAPLLPGGLEIALSRHTVSRPYLELTREVMAAFAAEARVEERLIAVSPGGYRASTYRVEPDWSGAAFLLVAARITGRPLEIPGLREDSLQGDRVIVEILSALDGDGPHEVDLSHAPDLISPVVVAALFSGAPTTITGIAHTRVKESDRPGVLRRELSRLGASITEEEDRLVIRPAPLRGPALLDPADDHRMAMAFGLVSLLVEGVVIGDRGCVEKSFPSFWETLEALR